jgi:hypothetical protein
MEARASSRQPLPLLISAIFWHLIAHGSASPPPIFIIIWHLVATRGSLSQPLISVGTLIFFYFFR